MRSFGSHLHLPPWLAFERQGFADQACHATIILDEQNMAARGHGPRCRQFLRPLQKRQRPISAGLDTYLLRDRLRGILPAGHEDGAGAAGATWLAGLNMLTRQGIKIDELSSLGS